MSRESPWPNSGSQFAHEWFFFSCLSTWKRGRWPMTKLLITDDQIWPIMLLIWEPAIYMCSCVCFVWKGSKEVCEKFHGLFLFRWLPVPVPGPRVSLFSFSLLSWVMSVTIDWESHRRLLEILFTHGKSFVYDKADVKWARSYALCQSEKRLLGKKHS
jgi:hypothetical protein